MERVLEVECQNYRDMRETHRIWGVTQIYRLRGETQRYRNSVDSDLELGRLRGRDSESQRADSGI